MSKNPEKYTNRATSIKNLSKFSRRIQLFTYFSVFFAGSYMVLFNDYSGTLKDQSEKGRERGHVFSALQEWVRKSLGMRERVSEPAVKE